MFETRPISNFLPKRSSCVLVSLNGGQRGTDSGRKPGARRLQRPAELARDLHGGAAQDLGVQLVGAGLDLLLGLHEQRHELFASERVAVLVGLLGEGVVDPGLPVDQGPVDVERDEGDFLGQRHSAVHCDKAAEPLVRARRREYDPWRRTHVHDRPAAGARGRHARGGGGARALARRARDRRGRRARRRHRAAGLRRRARRGGGRRRDARPPRCSRSRSWRWSCARALATRRDPRARRRRRAGRAARRGAGGAGARRPRVRGRRAVARAPVGPRGRAGARARRPRRDRAR